MSEYTVREVRESDLPVLAGIEKDCIPEPWSLSSFESGFASEGALFLCAEDKNGEIAGFVTASCVLDEVSVNNVAVRESFRRRGIAQLLLKTLEERVSDFASFITLEVRESNSPAITLYEKLGYKKIGARKNFYSSPRENALIMTYYFE